MAGPLASSRHHPLQLLEQADGLFRASTLGVGSPYRRSGRDLSHAAATRPSIASPNRSAVVATDASSEVERPRVKAPRRSWVMGGLRTDLCWSPKCCRTISPLLLFCGATPFCVAAQRICGLPEPGSVQARWPPVPRRQPFAHLTWVAVVQLVEQELTYPGNLLGVCAALGNLQAQEAAPPRMTQTRGVQSRGPLGCRIDRNEEVNWAHQASPTSEEKAVHRRWKQHDPSPRS